MTNMQDQVGGKINRDIVLFSIFSVMIFIMYLLLFFKDLSTTLSDYSWGDIVYFQQIFYNFAHQRWFQTSVYWIPDTGTNLFAYANTINPHPNFTPYLFSYLYALIPNIYGVYMVSILVNYLGLLYFSWKIISLLDLDHRVNKYLLILGFILISILVRPLLYKANIALYAYPFILASYYYLIKNDLWKYCFSILLLCLVSEDMAMLGLTFSVYIWFFEPERRKYALSSLAISLLWLAVALLIIVPWARSFIIGDTTHGSHLFYRFQMSSLYGVFTNLLDLLKYLIRQFLPLILFSPAFITAYLISKSGKDINIAKYLGLIIIAPLSHWGISVMLGGGHHLMPIIVFFEIAFMVFVCERTFSFENISNGYRRLAILFLIIFLASNIGYYLLASRNIVINISNTASVLEIRKNYACLAEIDNIPKQSSLCFWGARGLVGFLGNRSELWLFPDFYDLTDYLVIQKNISNTFYQTQLDSSQDIKAALKQGANHTTGEYAIVDSAVVNGVVAELVNKRKSHLIMKSDPNLLILRRINKHIFPLPK
jgi:hypothetical protein